MPSLVSVEAGNLRARFWHEEGRLRHAVDVRRGNRWRAFLVSVGRPNDDEAINQLDFLELAQPPTQTRAVFQAHLEDIAVGFQVAAAGPGMLYFAADLRLRRPADLSRFCQTYQVAWPALDDLWAPYMAPQPGDVLGQHAFRAPGLALQAGSLALCLIPDLDLIETTWTKMPVAFEIDADERVHERPLIAYGCINYRLRDAAFFAAADEPTTFVFRDVLSFGWYVVFDEDCPPGEAWRRVLRFCWEKWGRRLTDELRPQTVPWQRYAELALPAARDVLWTWSPSRAEPRGGIITGHIAAASQPPSEPPAPGRRPAPSTPASPQPAGPWPNDIWFSCRANDLFTALGLRLWAELAGDDDLARRAEAVKNLALSAPRDDGFFPTVYWFRFAAGRREEGWAASNFFGGGDDFYSTADMSWTAAVMLRWFELADADPRLIDFAEDYAWALLDVQAPSGAIPAWIRRSDRRPADHLAESVHTAACALFLAHLCRLTETEEFLEAALAAEAFVRSELLPGRRFADFEAFYDCPRLPLDFFDHRTRQFPQGTLAVFWTAEMYRALHLATGQRAFLDAARLWLDYLSLWQCIWDPPFFSTQVRGGFSATNADPRFADARSAMFAVLYADMYDLTADAELLRRATLAARAAFVTLYCEDNEPIAPRCFDLGPVGCAASAWGAGASDAPYPDVSFDWGAGSALAAAAYLRRRFGDLFIDARLPAAFGINALVVEEATIGPETAAVKVSDIAHRHNRVLVRGAGFAPQATIALHVAGAASAQTRVNGADLQQGIWLDIS